MRMRVRMRFFGIVCAVLGIAVGGDAQSPDGDYLLKVNRSMDLFGRVFREIAVNYMDEVDPEAFMKAGIEGMLGTLDPYTVYIGREDGDEVELIANGKYGGIGVTIGTRDGAIQVMTVMDGYTAQRQGVLPEDKVLEIDGIDMKKKAPGDVRNLTRGAIGTEVRVLIEREGEPAPLLFHLIREEIQVKNITYADLLEGGIGYVRLERFSRKAGEELRLAIREIQLKGELRGIVLDLRGNPGGLLESAVDVLGKFLPKGSLVVTTRGRKRDMYKEYRTTEDPLLPHTPLVILTDRRSASASEIVAGAVQDLDRGWVIGTRSFGKGLVQTVFPLNHGVQLKMTTAQYYIPSGRTIQELDYRQRDRSGAVLPTPDSLRKEFRTAKGRIVHERGGIDPDSVVEDTEQSQLLKELYRKSWFFRFANSYYAGKGKMYHGISDSVLIEFATFLKAEGFAFPDDNLRKVTELQKVAEALGHGNDVLAPLDRLTELLEQDRDRNFERQAQQIGRELHMELMARVEGESGRIMASLQDDRQLGAALGVLANTTVYPAKLTK
jgi:carboxyl-terminal processing protease